MSARVPAVFFTNTLLYVRIRHTSQAFDFFPSSHNHVLKCSRIQEVYEGQQYRDLKKCHRPWDDGQSSRKSMIPNDRTVTSSFRAEVSGNETNRTETFGARAIVSCDC